MKGIRRLAVPLAIIVLGFCAAGPLGSATVLALSPDAQAVECTCAHGSDHATCPMHHQSKDSREANRCRMRNTRSTDDAVLVSLFGSPGLPLWTAASSYVPEPGRSDPADR